MLKNENKISIIIPSYNNGHLIERAIKSVLNQTYQFWELIIIDNFSKDQTDDVIKSFTDNRIKILKINNKGVIAASRNLGIKNSNGKYIAFLDSDDWWASKKLEMSIFFLNKGFDLVYHDLFLAKNIKAKYFFRKVGSRKLKENIFKDLLENGNAIPNSSVVVKRSLLMKINLISENLDLIGWEDFDCWLRLSLQSKKFKLINKTLGFYWLGDNNMSNPKRTIENLNSFEHYYLKPNQLMTPNWVKYNYSISYYKIKKFHLATKYLIKSNFLNTPLNILLKNLYLFIFLKIKLYCVLRIYLKGKYYRYSSSKIK